MDNHNQQQQYNYDNTLTEQCVPDYQLHQLNTSYHHAGQYVISEIDANKLVDHQRMTQNNGPPTTIMYRSSSYRNSNNEKSIFPQKLWRLVNNQQMKSAIRWSEDGQSFFVYENPLQHMCLGKENNVFYTKQPKSFIRQLHLYGFRKINKNQFMHQFFVRGQPDLLKLIKRSYKQSSGSTSSSEKSNKSNAKYENKESSASKANVSLNDLSIDNINDNKDNNQLKTNVKVSSTSSIESVNNHSTTNATSRTSNAGSSALGTLDHDQVRNEFHSEGSQEIGHQQELQENKFSCHSEDVFVSSTEAVLTLSNNYDFCCPSQIDWYENNYSGIYNYDDESILYHNDIYPNTYDDNNITL